MIIRFIGNKAYWITAAIAFICAKCALAWMQFYKPEHPGNWFDD